MRKHIPIMIVIIVIIACIFYISNKVNQQSNEIDQAFIQKHVDQIYFFVPEAVIFHIEIYETDDETFLYIEYYLSETNLEERFVVATKVSDMRVTMATQELFPHIMEGFSDAQSRHHKKITLSDEEIQFYVDHIPN